MNYLNDDLSEFLCQYCVYLRQYCFYLCQCCVSLRQYCVTFVSTVFTFVGICVDYRIIDFPYRTLVFLYLSNYWFIDYWTSLLEKIIDSLKSIYEINLLNWRLSIFEKIIECPPLVLPNAGTVQVSIKLKNNWQTSHENKLTTCTVPAWLYQVPVPVR